MEERKAGAVGEHAGGIEEGLEAEGRPSKHPFLFFLPRAYTCSWGMSRKQCPLESYLASDCAQASLT